MGTCTSGEFAAAVSNNGGLGGVGSLFRTAAAIKRDIDVVRKLTSRPFAINHIPQNLVAEAFEYALAARPAVIPVVAAGGIYDGRGIAAALMLGAAGVNLGTRFIASQESPAPDEWKHAIVAAKSEDIMRADHDFVSPCLVGESHCPQQRCHGAGPARHACPANS